MEIRVFHTFLPLVNNVGVTIHVRSFVWSHVLSCGETPRVALLGHMGAPCLIR